MTIRISLQGLNSMNEYLKALDVVCLHYIFRGTVITKLIAFVCDYISFLWICFTLKRAYAFLAFKEV